MTHKKKLTTPEIKKYMEFVKFLKKIDGYNHKQRLEKISNYLKKNGYKFENIDNVNNLTKKLGNQKKLIKKLKNTIAVLKKESTSNAIEIKAEKALSAKESLEKIVRVYVRCISTFKCNDLDNYACKDLAVFVKRTVKAASTQQLVQHYDPEYGFTFDMMKNIVDEMEYSISDLNINILENHGDRIKADVSYVVNSSIIMPVLGKLFLSNNKKSQNIFHFVKKGKKWLLCPYADKQE